MLISKTRNLIKCGGNIRNYYIITLLCMYNNTFMWHDSISELMNSHVTIDIRCLGRSQSKMVGNDRRVCSVCLLVDNNILTVIVS